MNDDIDKADKIVFGDENFIGSLVANKVRVDPNTLRRGAYAEWFTATTTYDQWPSVSETIESQAERIVRIDAEERHKEPDDGLPPGPWERSHGLLRDAKGKQLFDPWKEGRIEALCDYVARCGSPAVRRLLAAFDVTEDQVGANHFSNALCVSDNGNVWLTTSPYRKCRILCWITPRSKQ